jgi:hypothetical protein
MKTELENFSTGWSGLTLELSNKEIDQLIIGLKQIQQDNSHIHFVSDFSGKPGIGDIEIACCGDTEHGDLKLSLAKPISPDN